MLARNQHFLRSLMASLCMIFLCSCNKFLEHKVILAKKGVATIDQFNPDADIFLIAGEWEIFDNVLIEPGDTSTKPDSYFSSEDGSTIKLARDVSTNPDIAKTRTYRVRINIKNLDLVQSKRFFQIDGYDFFRPCGTAGTFINGQEVCYSVAHDYTSFSSYGPHVFQATQQIEILIRHSRLMKFSGITFGSQITMQRQSRIQERIAGVISGTCLFLLFAAVLTFLLNPKDRIALGVAVSGLGILLQTFHTPQIVMLVHDFMGHQSEYLFMGLGGAICCFAYLELIYILDPRLRFINLFRAGLYSCVFFFLTFMVMRHTASYLVYSIALLIILVLNCYILFRTKLIELRILSVSWMVQMVMVTMLMQGNLVSHSWLMIAPATFAAAFAVILAVHSRRNFIILKRSRETIKKQNSNLERLDKLKDEFLANTSHELRTPLNGIVGLSESMLAGTAGKLEDNVAENLRLIAASGQSLRRLIDDILDFSQIRNQKIVFKKSAVDMKSSADIALSMLNPLASKKNLTLISKLPENLPPVYADEDRVIQVLYNLIGNAVKFTKSGGVEISCQEHETSLVIHIKDSGIGIPDAEKEKLFKEFEQLSGSSSREHSGTGLGLSITKSLIEKQGGKIWVSSTEGQGSTFSFSFPLAPIGAQAHLAQIQSERIQVLAESAAFDAERERTPTAVPTRAKVDQTQTLSSSKRAFNFEGVRIMAVDDEPVNLKVLETNLLSLGANYCQYTDPEEALHEVLSGSKPDLILLDVMMPRLTGYEFTQEVRKRYTAAELPIVLLTAKAQTIDLTTGFHSGANDYLVKPVNREELLVRVESLVDLAQLTNDMDKVIYNRTIDIIKILSHINEGIFTLGSDGMISERYSPKLENIFEEKNLAGQKFGHLLKKWDGLSNQELSEMNSRVIASIGNMFDIFDLNAESLPRSMLLKNPKTGVEKSISINYDPIVGRDNTVERILVSIRDVTEETQRKETQEAKDRELDQAQEILNLGIDRFKVMYDYNYEYLQRSIEITRKELTKDSIADLFRQLHSLKGNLLSAGLLPIVNQVHEAEGLVKKWSDDVNYSGEEVTALNFLISHIKRSFEEYDYVYKQYFANKSSNTKTISPQLLAEFDGLDLHSSIEEKTKLIDKIILDHRMISISNTLDVEFNNIPKIAETLGKLSPKISLSDHDIKIQKKFAPLIQDILGHMIRNSLDHGIETEDQRLTQNKSPRGLIQINCSQNQGKFLIHFKDDGQGLAIEKLRPHPEASDIEAAQQIFVSGKSTKDETSLISGRGAGLDSVKTLILQQGGDLKVEFTGDLENGYRPIEFIISLPLCFIDPKEDYDKAS